MNPFNSLQLGYAKLVASVSDTVDRRERDNRERLQRKAGYEADIRAYHERRRQDRQDGDHPEFHPSHETDA